MARVKVLIVDDDTRNIFALVAVLRARGYDCLSATGVKDAFNVLHHEPDISVILLDMMMPDMDGYEAIPLIRSHEQFARIPIISVTAQAMVGDKEKCLEAGADGYVSKPVDVDELVPLLQRFVKH